MKKMGKIDDTISEAFEHLRNGEITRFALKIAEQTDKVRCKSHYKEARRSIKKNGSELDEHEILSSEVLSRKYAKKISKG